MSHTLTVRKLLATVAFAILLVCPALAQTAATPDLSGACVLNLAKSKLGKHNTIASETIVITNKDSALEFRYTVDGKQSPPRTYTPDGKERTLPLDAQNQLFTKAQWKKSALTTESGSRLTGGPVGEFEVMHFKSRWTLSADGRTLTEEEVDSVRQTRVYDKQ